MSYKQKKNLLAILVVVVSLILAGLIQHSHLFTPLENFFFDSWHQFTGIRYKPEHVVIVDIDDQVLIERPDEPLVFWGPYFATVLEVMNDAGTSVVGIDFLFSISAESWLKKLELPGNELSRTFDIPIRAQLNAAPVVLVAKAVVNDQGESELLLPVTDYLFSLPNNYADLGLANLYPDEDGVVRRFVPALFDDDQEPRLTLAALLAKKFAASLPEQEKEKLGFPLSTEERPIGYVGPPGTFPRIHFRELLQPDAINNEHLKKRLKNKVVIIGGEHSGANDLHLTPYIQRFFGGGSKMMTGAELHANIVETLLTGKAPKPLSPWQHTLWILLVVTFGAILFFRSTPVRGLALGTGLVLLHFTIAYLLFLNYLMLPALQVPLSLGLCYVGSLGFRLSREERTRVHLQKAIGPYVSPTIVEKILESGKLPDLGGETLNVTVLFSDIRSFTTISEKLEPSEVVEMLNEYFSQACEPILAHGGMVDKFIGDAVMAVFGAPVPLQEQERMALEASLAMQKKAEEFRKWLADRFPDRDLPSFRIGIGMHTGDAVIGNIGSEKRMGYTAIGDAVNIASRLESLCKELSWEIVVSDETLKRAGAGFITGRTEQIKPRGREGSLKVHELLGLSS